MGVSAVSVDESSFDDFRELYRTHHGFVWHARHRFGTADNALEDAVQDGFVVAYRRRGTFSGDSTKVWPLDTHDACATSLLGLCRWCPLL